MKQPYLTLWFFLLRMAVYFGFFIFAALYYRWRSTSQDADGSPVHTVYMRKWSYACIPGMALSLTFSAFDWLMGLNFHWFSTMWGVYIFAGAAQSSMAAAIIVVYVLRSLGYLKPVNGEHGHIMGKLLLAFTVFWAYIAFSQYMLIWYANIPEETVFFIKRNVGSWTYLSVFLVAGHFVIPFVFLLTQAVKKSFKVLSIVAGWILFMHAVDLYWIILPQLHTEGIFLHWLDFTCFIGMASIMIYFFVRLLRQAELFPTRDPRIMQCVNLSN